LGLEDAPKLRWYHLGVANIQCTSAGGTTSQQKGTKRMTLELAARAVQASGSLVPRNHVPSLLGDSSAPMS
jgi:hypothetical protein